MNNLLKRYTSPTYDLADRTESLEIPAENQTGSRHIVTVVGAGADPTGGTVTVYCKALNSSRYFPLKDSSGNAVTISLATADHVVINGPVSGVKLGMASLAGTGVSGWYFVVSPI